MAKRTKGKCKYCGKEYTFSYRNKHLSVCKERQKRLAEETGSRKCGYSELAIYPKYNKACSPDLPLFCLFLFPILRSSILTQILQFCPIPSLAVLPPQLQVSRFPVNIRR